MVERIDSSSRTIRRLSQRTAVSSPIRAVAGRIGGTVAHAAFARKETCRLMRLPLGTS